MLFKVNNSHFILYTGYFLLLSHTLLPLCALWATVGDAGVLWSYFLSRKQSNTKLEENLSDTMKHNRSECHIMMIDFLIIMR